MYKSLILKIAKRESSEFLVFSNADGKKWIIQQKRMRIGLEIYEPSSRNGRLLKKYLPLVNRLKLARRIFHADYAILSLSPELMNILEQCFGSNYEYSVFGGTPCTDQKITIQISRDNKLLGYCKIGKTSRIYQLFNHEKECLGLMEKFGVRNVPKYLGMFSLQNQEFAFIQTTQKKFGSKTEHVYGKKQEEFLKQLFNKTMKIIPFEKTTYAQQLCILESECSLLTLNDQIAVRHACKVTRKYYSNAGNVFGMYHGDFTPWNCCVVNRELYVFDFEYALQTAPPGLDYWHFTIQTYLFEHGKTIQEIIGILDIGKLTNQKKMSLIAYLLSIIELYLQRADEKDVKTAQDRCKILNACLMSHEQESSETF